MKFEAVGIHFLSDVFSFVVILKFCYYGNVKVTTSLYILQSISLSADMQNRKYHIHDNEELGA